MTSEIYLGKMINHKTERKKISDKKSVQVIQKDWIINENTHEAIVTQEEYDKAQKVFRLKTPRPQRSLEFEKYP